MNNCSSSLTNTPTFESNPTLTIKPLEKLPSLYSSPLLYTKRLISSPDHCCDNTHPPISRIRPRKKVRTYVESATRAQKCNRVYESRRRKRVRPLDRVVVDPWLRTYIYIYIYIYIDNMYSVYGGAANYSANESVSE